MNKRGNNSSQKENKTSDGMKEKSEEMSDESSERSSVTQVKKCEKFFDYRPLV